ncbi:hypothetical protein QE370_000461 [Aeromicrobium sp. SORGH_AS981]|uniref:CBM96 family carbohydrate-binding protein n=1 Tax=Aeromicrobium sp. SORGH_AS_0981 TaxID=3041802 RepID=UPI00285D9997|nr:DNRLRE domain-containing protein [Aeromicrobium sp. SORGH_AS_0981]MDR6117277.1 hypothetical protein [Aeromicrobium sp. SORGH_AS_0981]
MTTHVLTVVTDAHVFSGNSDQNYGGMARLAIADATRSGYVYFNRPFPLKVSIVSATLRIYQYGPATGGNRTVTVQRANGPWSETGLTFQNRPGATGPAATRTQGDSTQDGRPWTFNVQPAMQQVADGADWWGFRIIASLAAPIFFYSKNANVGGFMATLEVEWSDAPDAPTECSPTGNQAVGIVRPTFRMDYTDPSGEDGVQGVQVQVYEYDPVAQQTNLVVDSGQVATDLPEWASTQDIAATARVLSWRGRVQDTAGNWSPYSALQYFLRIDKAALTLTNPSATVYTPTPSWSWTWEPAVSTDTQRAFQILVVDPDNPTDVVWTSGKQMTGATAFAMPAADRLVLVPGKQYLTILRAWGTVLRGATPGDTTYVEVSRLFTVATTGTSTVSSLSVKAGQPFPSLEWQTPSGSTPEEFVIYRNGRTIAIEDAATLRVSGTTYRYEDRTAAPGTTHTWGVATKTGATTANPVAVTGSVLVEGVWLYSLKNSDVAFQLSGGAADPEPMSFEPDEDVAIVTGYGASVPVMIATAGGVREPRRRLRAMLKASDLDAWKLFTAPRARTVGLMLITTVLKVQIYNVVTEDREDLGDTIPVSFDMIVVG